MLLEKIFNSKYILIILFVVLFVLTRYMGLWDDEINPDGVNWHLRSEQFVVGLKYFQLEKTFQHYHPGVTLMWITGPTVELIRQIHPEYRVYDQDNFLLMHFAVRSVLIAVQLALTFITMWGLSKILGFKKAYFVVALFTFEAFFIGNSRLLHMDILVTLFLFLGIVFSFLGTREKKWYFAALAGFFMGFAFLTKSIAIGGLLFILFAGGIIGYLQSGRKFALKYVGIMLLVYVATVFAFFPALWKDPIYVISEIFGEAARVGGRNGHSNFFFGKYTMDPGIFFYPVVFSIKTSILMFLGVLLSIYVLIKDYLSVVSPKLIKKLKLSSFKNFKNISFELYVAVFYIGYLVVMTVLSKKIDRYLVVMFPFFALMAVWAYVRMEHIFKNNRMGIIFLGVATVIPLITSYPYYFTYSSPLYMSLESANNVVGQKPFGIGIPKLKEFIYEKYGEYPNIGFIDTKPMSMIYSRRDIYDIRVTGTKDIALYILGPNEEAPDSVLGEDKKFVYDDSYKIQGFDYWRIYVREDWKKN